MTGENASQARLTDYQYALLEAMRDVVDQCHNVVEAHSRRSGSFPLLTANERTELAVLRIRLDDLSDVQATRGTEAS